MGEDMAVAAFKRQIIPPPATIDVFVIGGGIVGLAIAEDAARRGLSVLLCERGDFAAATSAGCFRLVHGGVRYLQHLDFGRMFASVREQTILRKRASHLIRPLPFLLPVYGSGKEGRLFLEAGMTVYEMLTCGRNRGAPKEQRLPRHSFVGRDEMLARFPGLKRRELCRGGPCRAGSQRGRIPYFGEGCARIESSLGRGACGCECNRPLGTGVNGEMVRRIQLQHVHAGAVDGFQRISGRASTRCSR